MGDAHVAVDGEGGSQDQRRRMALQQEPDALQADLATSDFTCNICYELLHDPAVGERRCSRSQSPCPRQTGHANQGRSAPIRLAAWQRSLVA